MIQMLTILWRWITRFFHKPANAIVSYQPPKSTLEDGIRCIGQDTQSWSTAVRSSLTASSRIRIASRLVTPSITRST